MEIRPQKGFQEKVLSCGADIAIVGGAAGVGKTWALLVEPLRWVNNSGFGCVYFRRNITKMKMVGGLIDNSKDIYGKYKGAKYSDYLRRWSFPSGASIEFHGIELEKDLENFQGSQIPLIIFDELSEFTERMFFFMLSRNRGFFGGEPYVRASCNPLPDSWLSRLLEWWIDQDTGFPIVERNGVIRYMFRSEDRVIFGESKEEIIRTNPNVFDSYPKYIDRNTLIKSFTFISGSIYENEELIKNNPGYLGSLSALPERERQIYLNGNWKIRTDNMGIYHDDAISTIFNVEIEYQKKIVGYENQNIIYNFSHGMRYITCDVARFGRDLCVIMVWDEFTVIHISILCISDPHDTYKEIEELRQKFEVDKINVCLDQDGVGGDVMRLSNGRYRGFVARRAVAKDLDTGIIENYLTRKDQCYFRSANRVNSGELKISLGSIKIKDRGAKHFRFGDKVKIGGNLVNVSSLICSQLRVIRVGEKTEIFGGIVKISVNTKEEQKSLLGGSSPDFADCIMMREEFELVGKNVKISYF